MKLGSALWTQYLAMTSGRDAQFDEAANALRDKAATLLTSGFAALAGERRADVPGAIGALYLVQLLLARGDAAGALEVLEDVNVGPLTLVEAEAPSRHAAGVRAGDVQGRAADVPVGAAAAARRSAGMMTALDEFAADQGGAAAEQLTRSTWGWACSSSGR